MSTATDPLTIALELRAELLQPSLTLVIVFVSADCDLAALAAALKAEFGRVPVIGCTTAGEITPNGYRSGTVTGISLASPDFYAAPILIRDVTHFNVGSSRAILHKAMQNLVRMAPHIRREEMFAFTLFDGLTGGEEAVVSGLYLSMAELPLAGGSAADNLHFDQTYLLFDGELYADSAVFVLVGTKLPFRVFKTEHFVAGEEKLVVSDADPYRRIVNEINAEPAAAEYARTVGVDVGQLSPHVFARHPLTLRIGGSNFVRSIQKVNADGGLKLYGAIDNGIVLTIGESVDLLENLETLFDSLRRQMGDPALILGFDCILRGLEMDEMNYRRQVEALMVKNKVIGFATYGEQYMSMHVNQTFSGIAIGTRQRP